MKHFVLRWWRITAREHRMLSHTWKPKYGDKQRKTKDEQEDRWMCGDVAWGKDTGSSTQGQWTFTDGPWRRLCSPKTNTASVSLSFAKHFTEWEDEPQGLASVSSQLRSSYPTRAYSLVPSPCPVLNKYSILLTLNIVHLVSLHLLILLLFYLSIPQRREEN